MSTNKNDKFELNQKIEAMKERELKEPEIKKAQELANAKLAQQNAKDSSIKEAGKEGALDAAIANSTGKEKENLINKKHEQEADGAAKGKVQMNKIQAAMEANQTAVKGERKKERTAAKAEQKANKTDKQKGNSYAR